MGAFARVWGTDMTLKRKFSTVLVILASLLVIPALAAAEDCSQLDLNPDWGTLFGQFNEQYEAGNYAAALETTQQLQAICSRSPLLNFSIAVVYRKLGDTENAKAYIRTATERTEEFAVSPDILASMWMMRYEIEHSENVSVREEYDKLVAQDAEYKKQLEDTTVALTTSNDELLKRREMMAAVADKEKFRNSVIMWTGTGIGVAGIAMTVVGAYMTFVDTKKHVKPLKAQDDTVKFEAKHYAALYLFGAGIAATVTGAVMAGLGGYYYTHPIAEDLTMAVTAGPGSLTVGLSF